MIDLPFAIPTLVTGVMLVLLYGPQTASATLFEEQFGTRLIYAPPGIVLALLFLGYPFVTRAVQPVLAGLDIHQQEAAHTLGASGWTTFRRVILPAILPAADHGRDAQFCAGVGRIRLDCDRGGQYPDADANRRRLHLRAGRRRQHRRRQQYFAGDAGDCARHDARSPSGCCRRYGHG